MAPALELLIWLDPRPITIAMATEATNNTTSNSISVQPPRRPVFDRVPLFPEPRDVFSAAGPDATPELLRLWMERSRSPGKFHLPLTSKVIDYDKGRPFP
jgi:hypothetical protein